MAFLPIIVIFLLTFEFNVHGHISDKRLCANPGCTEPISEAKTMILYSSPQQKVLSFPKNAKAIIYSKSAGSRMDLWGVEIGGRRGYAPKGLLREVKVFKSASLLTHTVPTEESTQNETKETGSELKSTSPNNTDQGRTVKAQTESVESSTDSHIKVRDSQPVPMSSEQSPPSFGFKGVSAEPLKSDSAPDTGSLMRPVEIVDGTTIYLDTNGEGDIQVHATAVLDSLSASVVTNQAQPSSSFNKENMKSEEPEASTALPSPESNDAVINHEAEEDKQKPDEEPEEGSAIFNFISNFFSDGSGDKEVEDTTDKNNVEQQRIEKPSEQQDAKNEDENRKEETDVGGETDESEEYDDSRYDDEDEDEEEGDDEEEEEEDFSGDGEEESDNSEVIVESEETGVQNEQLVEHIVGVGSSDKDRIIEDEISQSSQSQHYMPVVTESNFRNSVEDPKLAILQEKKNILDKTSVGEVPPIVQSRNSIETQHVIAEREPQAVDIVGATMVVSETPTAAPQTPAAAPRMPAVTPKMPAVTPQMPTVAPQTPPVAPQTETVTPQTAAVTPQTPTLAPQTPAVPPQTPALAPQTAAVTPQTPTLVPQTPAVVPQIPTLAPQTPTVTLQTPQEENQKQSNLMNAFENVSTGLSHEGVLPDAEQDQLQQVTSLGGKDPTLGGSQQLENLHTEKTFEAKDFPSESADTKIVSHLSPDELQVSEVLSQPVTHVSLGNQVDENIVPTDLKKSGVVETDESLIAEKEISRTSSDQPSQSQDSMGSLLVEPGTNNSTQNMTGTDEAASNSPPTDSSGEMASVLEEDSINDSQAEKLSADSASLETAHPADEILHPTLDLPSKNWIYTESLQTELELSRRPEIISPADTVPLQDLKSDAANAKDPFPTDSSVDSSINTSDDDLADTLVSLAAENPSEDSGNAAVDSSSEQPAESEHFSEGSELEESEESTVTQTSDTEELAQTDSETEQGFFSSVTSAVYAGYSGLTDLIFGSEPLQEDGVTVTYGNTASEAESEEAEVDMQHGESARNDVRDKAWAALWTGPPDSLQPQSESQACDAPTESCTDHSGDLPTAVDQSNEVSSMQDIVHEVSKEEPTMDFQKSSYNTVVYLVVTAVTVLLFSLGHYYLEHLRRDGSLVAKINNLEKSLLVASKECLFLKDELESSKEQLNSAEHTSCSSSEVLELLNIELEDTKIAKEKVEAQLAALEKELESATEAGLNLSTMLTNLLQGEEVPAKIAQNVEDLQEKLEAQEKGIADLNEKLEIKNSECEQLQTELTVANETISMLKEEIETIKQSLNSSEEMKRGFEIKLEEQGNLFHKQLEEALSSKTSEVARLKEEVEDLQYCLEDVKKELSQKDSEMSVLQDLLKQLTTKEDEGGMDSFLALLDVGHTLAELKMVTIQRDSLQEKLEGEEGARKLLEDHVAIITEEVTKLKNEHKEAEQQRLDAETKLEVLSSYFKEKETQLQKELGLQEAMCLQKKGEAMSTFDCVRSLKEEIENYKSQNETLKKEIVDQERGLKTQIATLEKKAHENWVSARQAERKLEETKQEASQLRNRLTVVEKNITNTTPNGDSYKAADRLTGETNGELPTSPIHLGLQDAPVSPLHYHDGLPVSPPLPPGPFMGLPYMPPPLGAPFIPPPPPPLGFPGDRRPPPLGRMSSPPPPPHGYSSPPPEPRGGFSPYDRSPTPPRPYRFDGSPDRFRRHSPPPPFVPYPPSSARPPPPSWDDPRSGFKPLSSHRDNLREPKGSALSSGHSSESLEKISRHGGKV